jgi:hypothetical protein
LDLIPNARAGYVVGEWERRENGEMLVVVRKQLDAIERQRHAQA